MPDVYYNENDKDAVAWLRALMAAGAIPEGDIDDRSIWDVTPADVMGYRQCHFFAGIGGWAEALRLAAWPDGRRLWTGSCPCQPFSAAGKGAGVADDRHLWPAWFALIQKCRPPVVVGEQVDAAIRHGWLDLVCADLETVGYAVGAVGLPAACVGAPHRRQRLWFVAESLGRECDGRAVAARRDDDDGTHAGRTEGDGGVARRSGEDSGVAESQRGSTERHGLAMGGTPSGVQSEAHERQRLRDDAGDGVNAGALADDDDDDRREVLRGAGLQGPAVYDADGCGAAGGVADPDRDERGQVGAERRRSGSGSGAEGLGKRSGCGGAISVVGQPAIVGREWLGDQSAHAEPVPANALGSFWSAADWLPCRDGKWRPVEPGTFPLAHGLPARVGRLRGYGNAIVPQVAAEVLRAIL